MSPAMRNPYKAYTNANHTVSKTRQVVMLYDGIIRNLKQAMEAMQANRIEDRYNKLCKASEIVIGLQMSLDFEQGEQAAKVLYDFYSSVDSRILSLHRSNNAAACDELIGEIKKMRELWDRIDKGEVDESGSITVGNQESASGPAKTHAAAAGQYSGEESAPASGNPSLEAAMVAFSA